MGRHPAAKNVSSTPWADSPENSRREGSTSITTTRKLLTDAWTAEVEALETAIGRFRPSTNDCRVVFFEIAGDGDLHVNITHKYRTRTVSGWAGPASLTDGFVSNRRFGHTQPSRMIAHIRDMVFAIRI
jgi:hypothetical protein